ncbi:LysR family transcriptional regulator [Pseudomonas sp. Marseille-QA0892]
MDRIAAMQAFARVVEAGSFTRAAETLQLNRASVTQLIQQLESRLRVKLLHRTTRQVRVTEDGAAYYERVIRLLADLDDAETGLSASAHEPRGRLRIDVPSPFASRILMPALPAFQARYPELHLHIGASDRLVDMVVDNVDCVVRGGVPTHPSLVARQVGDLPLGVYAAPGYLARVGIPHHPSELADDHHRIVGYYWARTGKIMSYELHRGDERFTVASRCSLTVDEGNAYLAAGVAGLGVIWLPTYMSQVHVERGELVPLFEDWHVEPMPLYVAYPPNRHVSRKLRVFIDWMAELIAEIAPVRAR